MKLNPQNLMSGEKYQLRTEIPIKIKQVMKIYKRRHKAIRGTLPTVEEMITKMLAYGANGLLEELRRDSVIDIQKIEEE